MKKGGTQMDKREPHKQMDIEQMRKARAAKAQEKAPSEADLFAHFIDFETDKAVVSVLHELGYEDAHEGMSIEKAGEIHGKLKENGEFINIATETIGNKYVVTVSVVQAVRTLEFDLGGENGGENDEHGN
jgi:hypothetical protein